MAEERPTSAPGGDRRGRDPRGGGDVRGEGGRGGRFQRRRVCAFCADKVEKVDYKDVGVLRRFLSDQGHIESRRRTGTCARHQRRLTLAIKRARALALLPYTAGHIHRFGG